jgi:hypothetical protein
VYLFDAAQAYRFDKQCGKAVTAYRAFLAAAAHPPNEANVRKYLAQVEACAATEKPAEPPPPAVEPPPLTTPSVVEPPREEPRVERAPERPPTPRRSHKLELALAGGAIVALAVAIGFTYDVAALEISREQLCPRPCTWDAQKQALSADLQSRGDRATAIAVTSYVVAGLAAGAGVAVYVVRRHRAEARVSAAPLPGGALVVASGRF